MGTKKWPEQTAFILFRQKTAKTNLWRIDKTKEHVGFGCPMSKESR